MAHLDTAMLGQGQELELEQDQEEATTHVSNFSTLTYYNSHYLSQTPRL